MTGATVIDTTRVLCALAELEATGCREFRLGGGEWPVKGFVVKVPGGLALISLPVDIVAGYVLLGGDADPAELAARYG